MNEDELGVQILSPGQIFVSDDDISSMFVEGDGVNNDADNQGSGDNSIGDEEKLDVDEIKTQNIVEKTQDVDVVDDSSPSRQRFKNSLLSLSKLGIIAEIDENSVFEGEEGEEIKFSDLVIEDEDTFNGYVKQLHQAKESKLLENKADLDGVSDLTKKIIEIDKAGGNISSVLEVKSKVLDNIEGLDLSVVDNQRHVVAHYLSTRYNDMSDDDIADLVKSYEDRGVLEEKATSYKKAMERVVLEYAESQQKTIEEQKKTFAEQLKGYKKSVKESVSSKFQLKDDYIKKLVDFATKMDDRYNPELLNKKYSDMIKNPDDAADLILFLYDKEEYLRQKTNKAVTEERRNVFKKLTVKQGKGGASTADVIKGEQENDNDYIPIKGNVVIKGNF